MRTARLVMLCTACLIFAPVTARAQSCGGEPSVSDQASFVAYSNWCICMGGTVAGDLNSAQDQGGCQFTNDSRRFVHVDPRQAALQNAIARYDTVARSLANDGLVDGSWFALPRGTEAEFMDTAFRMHRFLADQATRSGAARRKLLDELAEAQEVIEAYPGRIASLHAETRRLRSEHQALDIAVTLAQQELERTQQATKEIETRAYRYQEDVKRDQATILMWLAVFLPPAVVEAVSPVPYESIPILTVGAIRVRERSREAAEPFPIRAVRPAVVAQGTSRPLPTWTPEDVVALLERDALAWRIALQDDHGKLAGEVRRALPVAAQLREDRTNAATVRDRLSSEVESASFRLKEISTWSLLLAQDQLQSARETFVYRAADALIWNCVKSETKRALKREAKRLVAAKTMGVAGMTDENVVAYFNTGRRNVLGLSGRVLSTGHALHPVVNRFQILRTHALGNIEEAIRLISEGSPGEIDEFIGTMFGQMHDDTRELMKASLGAARVPEPWRSIYITYLLSPPG